MFRRNFRLQKRLFFSLYAIAKIYPQEPENGQVLFAKDDSSSLRDYRAEIFFPFPLACPIRHSIISLRVTMNLWTLMCCFLSNEKTSIFMLINHDSVTEKNSVQTQHRLGNCYANSSSPKTRERKLC